MNKFSLALCSLVLLGAPAAQAQVRLGIELGLPVMPELVVVAPGVQVVAGSNDEIFLQGGWYWCRRSDGWFRARSPRAHFEFVDSRRVPGALVRMPEGRYRNWHRDGEFRGEGWGHREERREERRDDRREERRDDRRRDEHEGHRHD